ncbi:Syntaxin-1A like protein [Dictyocoela muelleri]|nr:Syntaxin-1A like protein [Dictyocoela muelleri]
MNEILLTTKSLNTKITNLETLLSKLRYLTNTKRNSIMNEDEVEEIDNKIKVINDVFKRDVNNIKTGLETLITVNLNNKDSNDKNLNNLNNKKDNNDKNLNNVNNKNFNKLPPLERETRLSHYRSLSSKLSSLIEEYRHTQLFYSNSENDRYKSMYKIARPDLTDSEIEKLSAQQNQSPFGLTKKSKKLLSIADKRNKNIKEILKNIEDLTELMNDLSMMVNRTGEHVNKIEINMEKAEDDTEKANKDLDKALEYQKSYMWYKRLFYVVIVGVIIVFCIWFAKFIGVFG